MKIRIQGNSVRYRLTKPEVEALCNTGQVVERTQFLEQQFTYAIKTSDTVNLLHADCNDNTITLILNKEISKDWAINDVIGFNHSLHLEKGTTLELLVEKDFVCIDRPIADQPDNYPHPKMNPK